jgi:integrase
MMASITRRPDGTWRARYRDDAGKEHAKHFARKVDGQRWLDEITTAVVTGSYVDPKAGRVTFASFYADWSKRQIWQSGTVRAMDLAAKSFTSADLALGRIKKSHVEQWVKSMQVDGLAPGTVRTRYKNVHAVFRAAVGDKIIPSDACQGVKLPAQRRAEAAMRIPTADQVGTLLQAADEPFAVFLACCAFGGLRLGEASALQVGDIDFLKRRLKVERQVQGPEIRAPKYGSERVVYLPDDLLTMLSEQIARRGIAGDQSAWIFTSNGRPLPQRTASDRWYVTCKLAGVTGIRLHDLRHFFASGLIASGCDVVMVQRALGHAQATTTLNVYSHLWPSAEDRTRAAAADLMRIATPADFLRTEEG